MNPVQQAVILAGGRGERLRPITDSIPKPMVGVAGRPFLEHLLLLLKKNGIHRYLFLCGYRGDLIKKHFGDGRSWDVRIEYSFEENPVGTGGALRLAKGKLDKNFFLLFGDSYLPIDYNDMADKFMRGKKKMLLAIYGNSEDTGVPFNIKLDRSKNNILEYNKGDSKPPDLTYCDAGVVIMSRDVIGLIAGDSPISLEEFVYPKLIDERQLWCYISAKMFYDIGTPQRLKIFEEYISQRSDI